MSGRGGRSGGRGAGSHSGGPQQTCVFFSKGACRNGAACHFSHNPDDLCTFGARCTQADPPCPFRHPPLPGKGAKGGAGKGQSRSGPPEVCRNFSEHSVDSSAGGGPPAASADETEIAKIVTTTKARLHECLREAEAELEAARKRLGNKTSLEAVNKALAEHQCRRDKVGEVQQQIAVFHATVGPLRTALGEPGDARRRAAAARIRRECRRAVPPSGACLPFYAYRPELMEMIRGSRVSIVVGHTGSGKSTQMVQYLAEEGYADGGRPIVCAQPRKLAVTSLADRVAAEWGCTTGTDVGAHTGGHVRRFGAQTKMKYCTNRVLLNELLEDEALSRYSVVVVDEAHERTIDTDLLLGMLKKTLALRDAAFRLIITSATLDETLLSEYYRSASGPACPVIHIPGRTFPVDVYYLSAPVEPEDIVSVVVGKAMELHETQGEGHVLAFLTGQEEIDRAVAQAIAALDRAGRGDTAAVLPLHGKLPPEQTERVFEPAPKGVRKVIFATNQAETSVTIDGVAFVVDSGLAKEAGFDARRGTTVLEVGLINQSSAEQRKGRAGRTGPGACYRMYTKSEFDEMPCSQTAEILRAHLGVCVLQLKRLGVDVETFDFVERPPADALARAMETLHLLGCLGPNKELTELGRITAQLELEPMLCRMLVKGCQKGFVADAAAMAALLISGTNVFFRGSGSEEQRAAAEHSRAAKSHPHGDVVTALKVYREWEAATKRLPDREAQRAWCGQRFVNGKTMGMARQAYKDLLASLKACGLCADAPDRRPATDEELQQIIAEGFFGNLAVKNGGGDRAGYRAIKLGQSAVLHPASSLKALNTSPRFVVFTELTQTSRLFMRLVTEVDPEWIAAISPEFAAGIDLKRVQSEPFQCHDFPGLSHGVLSAVIGKGGSTITALEKRFGCVLEPSRDSASLRVWAAAASMEAVAAGVAAFLDTAKRKMAAETEEVPVAGSTRVILGAGATTQALLRDNEFRKMFVSCVPDWDDWLIPRVLQLVPSGALVDHQRRYVEDVSDGPTCSGTLTFADAPAAAKVKAQLDGFVHGSGGRGVLSMRPCVARLAGSQMTRNSAIRIHWHVGQGVGSCYVNFSSAESAAAAAAAINGRCVAGQPLQATFKSQKEPDCEMEVRYAEAKTGLFVKNLRPLKADADLSHIKSTKDRPGFAVLIGSENNVNAALALVRQRVDPLAAVLQIRTQGPAGKGKPLLESVCIKGIPKEFDRVDVERMLRDMDVPHYASIAVARQVDPEAVGERTEDMFATRLRSLITSACQGFGELEDMQLFPPEGKKTEGKAFATLSTPGAAAAVLDRFQDVDAAQYGLGAGKLRMRPDISTSIHLEQPMGQALKEQLDAAIEVIHAAAGGAVKITVTEKTAKGWGITINSEQAGPVTAARLALEPILTGTRFSMGENADTVQQLFNPRGANAMRGISDEVPQGYVHWDRRIGAVFLFGPPDARAALDARLRTYVQGCAADVTKNLDLSRRQGAVKVLVGPHGDGIRRLLKAHPELKKLTLNIQRQHLTASGPPEAVDAAFREAAALLDQGVVGGRSAPTDLDRPMCAVCYCEVEPKEPQTMLQTCGHVYHRECIGHALATAAKPGGTLPVKCYAEGCGQGLIVRDLTSICNADTLKALCRRSYRGFVDDNTATVRSCPSPDCPQTYDPNHPGAWQCDCCLKRYCIPCMTAAYNSGKPGAVEYHEGMSHADYQLRSRAAASEAGAEAVFQQFLRQDLAQGKSKLCPCCSPPVAFSKDRMCNHVTCPKSRRHWCFQCAKFHAATAGEVYNHMGSCPGRGS